MILELRGLSHDYRTRSGTICALSAVNLTIGSGELALVAGPSGSGTSTLLLAASGMRRPRSGHVFINGRDIYGLSASERAALRATSLGFVLQSPSLIPYLSVLSNVMLAAPHKNGSLLARANELLGEFGLSERCDHRPDQLSQGERQRVTLARAMLNRPQAIFADEPTGNLDDDNADLVVGALRRFADSGAAVMLVTHSTRHGDVADKAYQLDSGRVNVEIR